jgi:flagellar hook-associated protein 2
MGLSSPGIGSNLDINTIVTQLMSVEGRKLTTLQTQEASYQAKVSAFGQVQSAFSTFQTAVNSLSTVQQFQAATASVADSAVLSAKATSAATPGAYALEVSKLAQAQKLVTAGQASTTTTIGTGTITFQFGTISGIETPAIVDANDNETSPASYAQPVRNADGTYSSASFKPGTAESKTVTIGPSNNSLAGIRDAINGAKIGVTATIVNDGGAQPNRLVLTNSATGEASSMRISVSNDPDGGLSSLLSHDPSSATQKLKETVAAQDAEFTLDGLKVKKPSNAVTDAIAGVTLNLAKTNAGSPTTLTVARDSASVVSAVNKFVSAYNAIAKTLSDASAYDANSKSAAILNGDSSIRGAQNQLRGLLSSSIGGGYGAYSRLSDIGVTMQKNGTLELNSAKLTTALETNFNDVAGLFAAAGKASDSLVSYTTSTAATKAGAYSLNVSQMASQSAVSGAAAPRQLSFAAPDNKLSLGLGGVQSEITLNDRYDSAEALALDLQSKMNASKAYAGSPVKVAVVDGKIAITSDAYGSSSTFSVSGTASALVFGGSPVSVAGQDVAGTINGASATGKGRILTAGAGDAEGLQVSITGGTKGERGTVNFSRGYASQFGALVGTIIGENGSLDARTKGLNATITSLHKQQEAEQARLTNREAALRKQFTALDTQISKLNSVSSYLTQQLAQIAALSSSSD